VHTRLGSFIPPAPTPLPYHPLRPFPLPHTPSIPSRNYFALISNFVVERVGFAGWDKDSYTGSWLTLISKGHLNVPISAHFHCPLGLATVLSMERGISGHDVQCLPFSLLIHGPKEMGTKKTASTLSFGFDCQSLGPQTLFLLKI
jgi:hypothetical protein